MILWVSGPIASAHTHVEIVYRDGQLRLLYYDFDYGEANPADVLLEVGPAAARPVPPAGAYTNLLGEAGATTWVLPQGYNPELLWLGIGNESLRATDFVGPVRLTLLAAEGPGHFALFFTDAFGQPVPQMNTRDGVTPLDAMTVPLGSHLHCNWAFSAPGRYRLTFAASGTLRAGNTPITSEPADFFFEVIPPPAPKLALGVHGTDALQLTLQAAPGLNYVVEQSANLGQWLALTNLPAPTPVTTHLLPRPSVPIQFLRARLR